MDNKNDSVSTANFSIKEYVDIIQKNEHLRNHADRKLLADHVSVFMFRFGYDLKAIEEFCNDFNRIFPISGKKIFTPITSVALLAFILHRENEGLFHDMKNTPIQDNTQWIKIISSIHTLFDNRVFSAEERMHLEICIEFLILILITSQINNSTQSIDGDKAKNLHQSLRAAGQVGADAQVFAKIDMTRECNGVVISTPCISAPNIIREICKSIENKNKFEGHISPYSFVEAGFEDTKKVLNETIKGLEKVSLFQQETARQMKETDRKMTGLNKLFNDQWGRLVEALVRGKLVDLLKDRGIEVQDTHSNIKYPYDGKTYEFDIMMVNGNEVVVVEVKTTLNLKYVNHFISKLSNFKTGLPSYRDKVVYGAVAYLSCNEESNVYAEKKGLFVIKAVGDSASITNEADFQPTSF